MNHCKLVAWVCTAALLICASGCGSESPDAEIEMSAVTSASDNNDDNRESTSKTVSTTAKVTSTSTTASSTKTSGSSTAKATASGTAAKTTGKNNGGSSGGNQNNTPSGGSSSGNNSSGSSSQNQNSSGGNQTTTKKSGSSAPNPTTTQTTAQIIDENSETIEADATVSITLNGSSAQVSDSSAVTISGNVITILQDGRYEVTGTLNDGQLIVDAGKESKVDLHLNGVGLTCSYAAALYVLSSDTCVLHLDDGSTNYIQDTAGNTQSAAVLSKDDLTIKGNGSLTVIGNVKHAIKSSNDVKIKNGTLTVSSVSTGIYGEDSVQITGGSITISACKDGIKSSNEEEAGRGYVTIENAWIDIQNALGNGIQAVTGVTISSGTVNVHSAKKAINCDYQSVADGCLYTY